ncbi:hypothetical protein BGZ47_009512 [Haplosporangium gracile]|nr:hypothetical protein BGZ47_009512 [Haplosporangium gracile]
MGEEHLLNTFVTRSGADPTESTKVCLVMSERSTSLMIKDGLFVGVCLTAINLPSLTQQFLAQLGQLNGGRLAISSMYLLKDFEKAEQLIVQTLLYPVPSGGNNSSSSYSANVACQLRDFTLRDTHGRNGISARYTLPAHPSSQLLERSSIKMSMDMVLVEKIDTDYHSFFWANGHAVKPLILIQDTVLAILLTFDKATANSTAPAQHKGVLQLTNLVVSLKGLNITSTFHLHNVTQRSKGTFKQLTLCGDITLKSQFETETLLNLLPAFVGEQVVLLRESQGAGTRMQEWEDLMRRLLPEGTVLTLAEDRCDLYRLVPGLTMSIAEHL